MSTNNEVKFYPVIGSLDSRCSLNCSTRDEEWVAHNFIDPNTNQQTRHVFHKNCLKQSIMLGGHTCSACDKKIDKSILFTAEELPALKRNETLREAGEFLFNVCAVACVALAAVGMLFHSQ